MVGRKQEATGEPVRTVSGRSVTTRNRDKERRVLTPKIPSRAVVYVACLRRPAESPLYREKKPAWTLKHGT